MTNFEKTTLTQKGINLLAKQGNQIEFLGVETGSGIYSQREDVAQLTDVKKTVQTFRLTSVKKRSAEELALKFVLTNRDLTEDYPLTEIGLYAHDPDEGKILYAVCCSTPENADMIRKYNGVFAFTVTIVLNVKIHPDSDVIIHTEGIYALSEDLEEVQENVEALTNPVYSTPTKRENLVPGEESTKAWGKVRRFFSDLTSVAFSGKYSDLNGTPDIPGKVSELENDEGYITNNDIASKVDQNSPILTGIPKAPTATAGTNTTQIATTAFVQNAVSNGIAASDAMIIKGTIGTTGTVTSLPNTYKTGWTYRVVTEGTYAGQVCEIGDLIVALFDRNGTNNLDSDWCVAQTNINGAITGIKSGSACISVSQSGSVVTITHKDISRLNTTSNVTLNNGGTFSVVGSVTSDAKGHITKVVTKNITLPTFNVDSVLSDSSENPVQNKVISKAIFEVKDSVSQKLTGERIVLSPGEGYTFEEYPIGKVLIVSGEDCGMGIYHVGVTSYGQPSEMSLLCGNLDESKVTVWCDSDTSYQVVLGNGSSGALVVTLL